MKPVFKKPSICEKHIKETLAFPPFIMMENAASALENAVLNEWNKGSYNSVLIISGKGNNGADGLALARKLFGKIPVFVYCPELPQTEEGSVQSLMAKKLKIPFLSYNKLNEILKSKTENIFVEIYLN